MNLFSLSFEMRQHLASGLKWISMLHNSKRKRKKTYNSGYSLVVTHPTTNPPI
ncbi:hypothetical protein DL95DRAFT_393601 [Leptodontidium sp. 2 PMI_412]|nr:hypothetical protein DL95DRAFT_393601 [Leptodontidium sp. 2 PMI_412]